MPRVAQAPRASNGRVASGSVAASPFKSPVKIPLNDDAKEKARRLQSRHALYDIHMNQIKAAASPMRKSGSPSANPKTPRHSRGYEDEEDVIMVGGSAVTPMKRVPILANFEEWMRMATDNKINATNSWNFALIDYFHDMSLLKEGDGVNFQKASCTLDGCVKIYTSRVDSVATETGKLLSGLADSGTNKKKRGESEEGGENEEEVEDEDGVVRKKPQKRAQRSSEATLATSFASLQLKRFELEFSVDPLFKKASADFDEGGAKGLLLNHLSIDSQGRIVFDSSDDAGDATGEGSATRRKSDEALADDDSDPGSMDDSQVEGGQEEEEDVEIDIGALGAKFFSDLGILNERDICPSLKNFDLGDPSGSMDIPFLKAPEDWRQEKDKPSKEVERPAIGDKSGMYLDDDNPVGFDDDDDGLLGNFDIPADTGFGEGGEAWARDAAIETRMRVHDAGLENDGFGGEDGEGDGMPAGNFDPETGEFVISIEHRGKTQGNHHDILSYFDEALQKNWAGPEHWRIRKIKDINKPATATKVRKEKELFEIDFSSPLDLSIAETIYTPATTNAAISLPKKDWKSKTKNLLPDDKHFNSKQLLRLFLKPDARMGGRRPAMGARSDAFGQTKDDEVPEGEMDEGFWARKEGPAGLDEEAAPQGDYDANFFQDDGLPMAGGIDDDDDMEFADARDHFSPGAEDRGEGGMDGIQNVLNGGVTQATNGAFGTQLVTQSRRVRPEYVQYARVAKKVDVRRLKEELWKGMGIEELGADVPTLTPTKVQAPPPKMGEDGSLKFTSVMENLQSVYPKQAMDDISTSYCFICLLHLANEKGLVIENNEGLMELNIRKDPTAEITVGG
ncbi:putative condensin complex subunit 2 [Amylocarpus encephaloides]|uniref:Condensin complex subunit 2 n=1 Tax=Amylocarpus encephaloides TaxID=45428 RepID=A0A9P8CAN0_9HELO|nr:putative condensin complex subunit 2 [Amylocarpus encephaloides]